MSRPFSLFLSRDLKIEAPTDEKAAEIAQQIDEALDRILDFHAATTDYTLTAAHRGTRGKCVYEREEGE